MNASPVEDLFQEIGRGAVAVAGVDRGGNAARLRRGRGPRSRPTFFYKTRKGDVRLVLGSIALDDLVYDEGVEVKSDGASPDAHQRDFDDRVRSGTPATGILDGKSISVSGVTYIQVRE